MLEKDKKFEVKCTDCWIVMLVAYSTYRHIIKWERKNPPLCRKCLWKINNNVFKKWHTLWVRFGYGQKEYRWEYTEERTKKAKETKILNGVSISGEKHWNWKGGITDENHKIRQSTEYKEWRKSVFKRDNYTCTNCWARWWILNADHIQPFSLFPELRLVIENGRTLCKECHDIIGWSLFKENNPQKK